MFVWKCVQSEGVNLCETIDSPLVLKRRYDEINRQTCENYVEVSRLDSNRLYEDSVEKWDSDCGKRQHDIENEEIRTHLIYLEQCVDRTLSPKLQCSIENEKPKEPTRPHIIFDFEQVQDSSLPPVENLQFSLSSLLEHDWETTVKSVLCGSWETSVKTQYDFDAETVLSKSTGAMHYGPLDLTPVLEKGSVEAQDSEKTDEGHDIEVGAVSDVESFSKEHAAEEKEESVSKSLASAVINYPAQKTTTSEAKKTAIKHRHGHRLTERQHDWEKARNSANVTQKSASILFPMKTLCSRIKLSWYWDWILPWLLPSKHLHTHRSEQFLLPGSHYFDYYFVVYMVRYKLQYNTKCTDFQAVQKLWTY